LGFGVWGLGPNPQSPIPNILFQFPKYQVKIKIYL